MVIRTLGSRYLLDEQIGQGGMGVVWRGRDKVTGSPYAIKLLRSEYATDPDAVTRFVRERTVLMKFRHPAVVTLHDMIVEGEQLALVMDLVGGGDLNAYRRRSGGTLSCAEAARLSAQVCDGLAAAHAAGIVHRDLKPANVLLDAGQVKLADFGVARIVGDPSGTTTGTVLGTAAYLAPELLTGSEPSPACDVYAFGIALYELLAGGPPFSGHVAAIMHDHLQTAPTRLPDVPDRLWDLLSSCLAKDPAARPTAAAMADALRDPGLLAVLAPAQAAPQVPVTAAAPVNRQLPPQSFAQVPSASPGPAPVTVLDPQFLSAPPSAASQPSAGSAQVIQLPGSWPAATPPAGPDPLGSPPGPPDVPTRPAPRTSGRKPSRRNGRSGMGSIDANPAVLGIAAVVVLALVATGIMAFGHIGPFGSGHNKTAANAGHTGGSNVLADPGRNSSATTGPARPSPSHSTPGHGKKASAKKSLPPVSATRTSSGKTGGGSGGTMTPYGPNLVADGTFSDPTLISWNYAVYQAVLSPAAGINGQSAAVLTATPEAGIAETLDNLRSGGRYVMTGWVKATATPVYIGARDDVNGTEVDVSSQSASWKKLTVSFTVPQGHSSAVVFCVQRRGGTGYCSDIAVHALRK